MIKSLEVKNFKAIEKAKLKLTPITAFIGYNGMGKSSLLEALQMFQTIVAEGLDSSIRPWRDFEHIYYKGKKKKKKFFKDGIELQFAPMEFSFKGSLKSKKSLSNLKFSSSIAQENIGKGNIYFLEETVSYNLFSRRRDSDNNYITQFKKTRWLKPDKSILSAELDLKRYIESWQFLSMNTFLMGEAFPQKKSGGSITLNKDGRNLAEYLLSIRDLDGRAFNGILETLQTVLPYAQDLQPQVTRELEKTVYLQLTEQDFKLPGWMLSTGTLKILALLAVFRHPEPSPLIVIEEIENGLDPRTINLIINEIKSFVRSNNSQVIITTHSPFLLDLLHLSHIVFVERKNEKVVFKRPYDDKELREWSKDYTPGELYEKDLLQQYLNK
jgi:predicted ATPase